MPSTSQCDSLGRVSIVSGLDEDLQTSASLAIYLVTKYMETGQSGDLILAIAYHCKAERLLPIDEPSGLGPLKAFAKVLLGNLEQQGRLEDIDEAIVQYHTLLPRLDSIDDLGVADQKEGSRLHALTLSDLADAYIRRFELCRRVEDVDQAIKCYSEASALCPGNSGMLNNVGFAFSARFKHSGRPEDIGKAIKYYEGALALCHADDPHHFNILRTLTSSFSTRYTLLHQPLDLDEAITYGRKASQILSAHDPRRVVPLVEFSRFLVERFHQISRIEDINEAVLCCREILSALPSEGNIPVPNQAEMRATCLGMLVETLRLWFQHSNMLGDLDEAIELSRKEAALKPNSITVFGELANSIETRFRISGNVQDEEDVIQLLCAATKLEPGGSPHHLNSHISDLEEAVSHFRKATDMIPLNHPKRPSLHMSFASCLQTRFERQGQIKDIDEAVSYLRNLLSLPPSPHGPTIDGAQARAKADCTSDLASAFLSRFNHLGRLDDLEEAIKGFQEAIALCPGSAHALTGAARTTVLRFYYFERPEDLEQAIIFQRRASAADPQPCNSLSILSTYILDRYKWAGNVSDLEESTRLSREALKSCASRHLHRVHITCRLAQVLVARYESLGQAEDLTEAEKLYREVLASCPPEHPEYPLQLNGLAGCLMAQFTNEGRKGDLDEASMLLRSAFEISGSAVSKDARLHAAIMSNMGRAMFLRFMHLGRTEDLEEAILRMREALDVRPSENAGLANDLTKLATVLYQRYGIFRRIKDLHETVNIFRRVLELRPEGHASRISVVAGLGNCLTGRYEALKQIGDLEEGIALHRKALSLCQPGQRDHAPTITRHELAAALVLRYRRLDKVDDLQEAIVLFGEARALYPTGHFLHAAALYYEGVTIRTLYDKLQHPEDLAKAIALLRNAVATLHAEHTLSSSVMQGLAGAYARNGDLGHALELYRSAADHPTSSPKDRLEAAMQWASIARLSGHPHQQKSAVLKRS
ncbi:hypothetical protein PHLCEN_2v7083 [Hermanssonia centrifuga]|uniref:TPR-like protein n=1 Tax=Hermanssonia centrifuga TaxID=98765 RepID=A0A2R6NXG9_9APHY|nr:hypothetical protein PHLCEN_2v7083 [Hermanssonia centrifuga]